MAARLRLLAFGAATMALGLAVRFAPLGLPTVVVKYGGSALWAAMIYWLVAALRPGARPTMIAPVAAVIATMVEVGKLYHRPALDAFRHTLPGMLLLGRIFSPWDLLAYAGGIALAVAVDRATGRRLNAGRARRS